LTLPIGPLPLAVPGTILGAASSPQGRGPMLLGDLIDSALARVREGLRHQHPTGTTDFKDRNRELQELAREAFILRVHNRQFEQGELQDKLLMFAEGAMILVCMERFLRALLGVKATNADTL